MAWRTWGEGRPIVLLHGGHGSWTHWCRNIPALVRAGRQVWAPDLPGFGDSPPIPGAEDADGLVAPLADAMESLFGPGGADLVAFSFGAIVAGLLAAGRPHQAMRLVLVGATGLGLVVGEPLPMQSWRKAGDAEARLAAHRHNLAALMLHVPPDGQAIRLQADNVERTRLASLRLAHSDVLLQALARVRCPVFGIWGEHDALYRGRMGLVETALGRLASFRELTIVPGAGHWVQYDAAPAFDAALLRALDAA